MENGEEIPRIHQPDAEMGEEHSSINDSDLVVYSTIQKVSNTPPLFWLFLLTTPIRNSLVKRKTIERILKAPLGLVHFIAWILSFYSHPVKTFILFAVYAYLALPGYQKFFRAFPYMKKYWWVAVLVDNSYVIIGIWAWMTLSNTTWERGEGGWKVAAAACAEDAHEN